MAGLANFKIIAIASLAQMIIVTLFVYKQLTDRETKIQWEQSSSKDIRKSVQKVTSTAQEPSYDAIVAKRVTNLRNYCTKYKVTLTSSYFDFKGLPKKGLPTVVWIASPYHKLFYCATPKAASTSWKTYIMKDMGIAWNDHPHM